MEYKELLEAFRDGMRERGLDAYIIYSADPHKSVAVADHWRAVRWFCGFTGWVGTLAITMDQAAFWTDGRYVDQAKRELEGKEVQQFCIIDVESPSLEEWLVDRLAVGAAIGYDGRVLMISEHEALKKGLLRIHPELVSAPDLLDTLWTERPSIPDRKLFDFPLSYAGVSRQDKLACVRKKMKEKGADYYLCSGLDDIAWLTNLRGGDSPLYPVFHGYVLISSSEAWLFTEKGKVDENLKEVLERDGIGWKEKEKLEAALERIPEKSSVYLDPWKTCVLYKEKLPSGVLILEGLDLITALKSVKNKTELKNLEAANEKEGVSVVRLMKYIKENIGNKTMDEYSVGQWIHEARQQFPEYLHPANIPIVGCRGNAAQMHYRPTREKSDILPEEGFLLFDLCAHYMQGSTDITRTIALGKLTDIMKRDYTMVLKSHIKLAEQKFPYGCTGPLLDSIVKGDHWNRGMNYGAGTGHGMGYCTYIQEGPCKIAMDRSPFFHYTYDSPIEPGMIFSNEPGVYRMGSHAIRLENTIAAVEAFESEFGRFLGFETLTYIPFEREAIVPELLTGEERRWVNHYHEETYRRLSPYLTGEEKAWLRVQTAPILSERKG